LKCTISFYSNSWSLSAITCRPPTHV